MTDNEITREMTFSEELPYFKERIKEIFDNYDNPDGYADLLYLSAISASKRIVRKAEEEIKRKQEEIESLKATVDSFTDIGKLYSEIKAEAIKEFAERLKSTPLRYGIEHTEYYDKPPIYKLVPFIDDNDIDNLVKEMVGDGLDG